MSAVLLIFVHKPLSNTPLKNFIKLQLFFILILSTTLSFAQTSVKINGSLGQAKPTKNNGVVAIIQPTSPHYNARVYQLDSMLTVNDSFSVPNPRYTGTTPVEGDSNYDGILAGKITCDSVLHYSSFGLNTTGQFVNRLYRKNNTNHILSIYRKRFFDVLDRNGLVYGLFSVGPYTWIGTGIDGSGGTTAVPYTVGMNTSVVVIADSTAHINSTAIGRKYVVYKDANFGVVGMSFLDNGNLLLKAISPSLNQTRFIEIDSVNTITGLVHNAHVIRDTTINGPADMLELSTSNFAILSDNGTTFSVAGLNILDSNWNIIKIGYQYIGGFALGEKVLHNFDQYIFTSHDKKIYSQNGNIFEHNQSLSGWTIGGSMGVWYNYNTYADSVVFGKQSFLPNNNLLLTVKDTHPGVLGAYAHTKRYNGTDSLVFTNENTSYYKCANATTYTQYGVGNVIPTDTIAKLLGVPVNQLPPHGWFLGYDSLSGDYNTYGHTVNSTETFSSFTQKKIMKLIFTTDPVDTAVIYVPPPNNIPWHTVSSQTWYDTLTLNKSFVAGGATDADGDTLRYFATGLPAGKTIDSVTGVISGVPTVIGTFPIQVWVTDSKDSVPKNHTIIVSIRHYSGLDNKESVKMELFPNPASEVVVIKHILVSNYHLYASNGQLVAQGKTNSIEVSQLPAGVYQLVVTSQNGAVFREKVVVE